MKLLLNRLAIWWLMRQMRANESYAWAWHSRFAVIAFDGGLEHHAANRAACNFMQSVFGYDTRPLMLKNLNYPYHKKS